MERYLAQLRGGVSSIKGTAKLSYMGRTHSKAIRRKLHFVVLTFIYDRPRREKDHGLQPLPTAEYPDLKVGMTLKCTRKQEAVGD